MNCPHCGKAVTLSLSAGSESRQPSTRPASPPADSSDVGELLNAIDDAALDSASQAFVRETRARYDQYHDRIRMSEKQLAWLKKLAGATGQNDPEGW